MPCLPTLLHEHTTDSEGVCRPRAAQGHKAGSTEQLTARLFQDAPQKLEGKIHQRQRSFWKLVFWELLGSLFSLVRAVSKASASPCLLLSAHSGQLSVMPCWRHRWREAMNEQTFLRFAA